MFHSEIPPSGPLVPHPFRVHARCRNCLTDRFTPINMMGKAGDAGAARRQVVRSRVLEGMAFECSRCGSQVGQFIGLLDGHG
jgi:hypothetical protein